MKLEISVYVPTERSLAAIIANSKKSRVFSVAWRITESKNRK